MTMVPPDDGRAQAEYYSTQLSISSMGASFWFLWGDDLDASRLLARWHVGQQGRS
jgi:hypothetical protein